MRTVKRKNKKEKEKEKEKDRGSSCKHVTFPKKKKKKKKEKKRKEATLVNKGEGRWVISHQIHSLPTFLSNTVFGWGEFREDGKHRKENSVKNSVFHCLAKEGK